MPSKGRIAAALMIMGMGLVILIQALWIGLPMLAERAIKSRLPQLPNGFAPEFKIESIEPDSVRITAIRIGKDVSADSLVIFYTLGGQRPFEVKKIKLSGLVVTASVDEDYKAYLNGMALNGDSGGGSPLNPSDIQDEVAGLAAFIPKQIVIDNARLKIKHKGASLDVPFYCRTVLTPETGAVKSHAVASVLGQPIEITAGASILKGLEAFTLDSRAVSPACFSGRILPEAFPLILKGPVDLHGEMAKTGEWQCRLSNLGVQGPDLPRIVIENATGRFNPKTQAFYLASELKIPDLFTAPFPLVLALNGSLNPSESFSLSVTSSAPPDHLNLGPDLAGSLSEVVDRLTVSNPALSVTIEGNREQQQLKMQVSGKKVTAENAGFKSRLSVSEPVLTAESGGDFLSGGLGQEIRWTLKSGKTEMSTPDENGHSQTITAAGAFRLNPENLTLLEQVRVKGQVSKVFASIEDQQVSIGEIRFFAESAGTLNRQIISTSGVIEPVSLHLGKRKATAAKAGWEGRIILQPDRPVQFDLTPWVAAGRLSLPEESLTAEDIEFKTRITHPFVKGAAGTLSIGKFLFQNKLSARFSSTLEQLDTLSYSLTGTLSSTDLLNKNLDVSVKAGIDKDIWAQCHVTSSHFIVADENVRKIAPKIRFAGTVHLDTTADVWASYAYGKFSSRVALKIHDGSMRFPDSNLAVEGVTGQLNIRDLIRMESYPGQVLNIDTISMGQFNFKNASLRFRIEDPGTLGIENLSFNWCNGLVSSEATQLPPADGGPFRLILFCDRLEMAALLNQMGAFDAEGGGTLSGRIPVTYSNGNLSFDNGFLFSTPGQGGKVAVRDLDRLMAGFPKGTPESSYLEMAGEALRDFKYNWATLKMNSQGDTLTVNMELDGKPANILPFEFKKETNAFVRVDAKSPGANFQGIKLDLNLTLPFNEVAKFGTKIKGLMD